MDYFSKFLRPSSQPAPKPVYDHAAEFHKSWTYIKDTLAHPDERQLTKGIKSTDVPARLKSMVDSLVWESTRADGVAGACMEYLLKNDVLGNLVQLSEADRPAGVQAEVLRSVQSMVVLLDEQFLVHSAVHKAILRLLRTCVGENLQEQLDGRSRVLGAAGTLQRAAPSEYEEDLVDLLCILCSRIRTFRELLMIFFHDKHVFHSDSHTSGLVGLEDDSDEDDAHVQHNGLPTPTIRAPSPTPSEDTISSEPNEKKPEYEFILFNYLLRFVHREGKIGEFARAGLLFLLDVAMSPGVSVNRLAEAESGAHHDVIASPSKGEDPVTDAALSLAEYILDGDFSEVLSAGLGAVYSLLPSKLQVKPITPKNALQPGAYEALENREEQGKSAAVKEDLKARGIQQSSNPDFQAQLDHFLRLVDFLEDVLRRNSPRDSEDKSDVGPSSLLGSAIVQSILGAVRKGFFENVLYPSILECSSVDGSAVAVLSYVEIMLVSLREGRLVETLLDFLMSEDDPEPARRQRQPTLSLQTESKAERLKRQKSSAMMLLEMEAPDTGKITEYVTNIGRFTLKDLLSANLASKSQPSATAALQLLSSLFTHHCEIVVDKLLIAHRETPSRPPLFTPGLNALDEEDEFVYSGTEHQRTTSHGVDADSIELPVPPTTILIHEKEMDMYHMLVSRIDPTHESLFSTGYEHYLRDAVMDIQQHPHCGLDSGFFGDEVVKYRLDPNDRMFTQVLQSLRSFFSNSPQMNMALTGALATLASCPSRSLDGWLTYSHNEIPPTPAYEFPVHLKEKDLDDDASIDSPTALASYDLHSMPVLPNESSQPIVYLIFQGLVSQLSRFQDAVPQFDTYLSERRRGLLFSENLSDALNLSMEMSNTTSPPPSIPSSSTGTATPTSATTKTKQTSSWTSFLSPKKTRSSSKSSTTPPNTNEAGARGDKGGKTADASPFGAHYQRTRAITLEVVEAPMPFSALWRGKAQKLDFEDEENYGGWGGSEFSRDDRESSHAGADGQDKRRLVPLSQVLDNVVILEEAIKELTSLIHARRCLGIDSLRYL